MTTSLVGGQSQVPTVSETLEFIYELLGRRSVAVGDLPELQLHFLGELEKLNEHTYRRYHATKDLPEGPEQDEVLAEVAVDEEPIKERAGKMLKVLWLIRTQYEERIVASGPKAIAEVRERCRKDPIYFINHFCCIHEPRMPEIGLSADLPFIMYPSQQRIISNIEAAYHNRQDLLVEKSREAGITWGVCALLVHHWDFMRGFTAITGSEKEEKVDILGSRKPLFGKLRYLIYHLPSFLRPTSFEKENGPNDNFRRIVNPDNGAEISGEAGKNIGRSGRASIVVIDESQALETPDAVDSALESVVNCRIDIGTPLGMNHFGQKRHSGRVRVSTIPWWEDPRKNPDWESGRRNEECWWYKLKKETRDPVVIAQEYDLDYRASVEGLFIPSEWVMAAVDFTIPADGESVSGFDPAGRGKNNAVYANRRGPVLRRLKRFATNSPTEAMWQAIDETEADEAGTLNYDLGGLGESIWNPLNASERQLHFRIHGIDSGVPAPHRYLEEDGKFADEKFRNKRAEMWWNLRTRCRKAFEHRNHIAFYPVHEMISLPNNVELINQLTAPKMVHSAGGKIGVESKKEMRTRGVKSPDDADAVAYAYNEYYGGDSVVTEFDYRDSSTHFADFEMDHLKAIGDSYAVIYQGKNLVTNVLCCLWKGPSRGLYVYDEAIIESSLPEEVVAFVQRAMRPDVKHIREWLANDGMFTNMERGTISPFRLYRKAGIRLKRNYLDDDRGSKLLLNQMFRQGLIHIHRNCVHLFNQLRDWKKGGEDLGLPNTLCLIVTRLRRLKQIYVEELIPGAYGRPAFARRTKMPESAKAASYTGKRESMYG